MFMIMKKRGRPSVSIVRDRLKEILSVMGKQSAYDAHKLYCSLFSQTSQRNVYYQLSRGVDKDEFVKQEVEESGSFSWGSQTRKVYYALAPSQKVLVSALVKNGLRGKV